MKYLQFDYHLNKQVITTVTSQYPSNCDIPILFGDCCIAIKGFIKGQYELVSTSETTLKNAMTYLSTKSKAKFVPAKQMEIS